MSVGRRFRPPQALTGYRAPDGTPRRFLWRRRWHQVARIERSWVQQWAWWQGAGERLDRQYFDLTTTEGLHCVIYEDRAVGGLVAGAVRRPHQALGGICLHAG